MSKKFIISLLGITVLTLAFFITTRISDIIFAGGVVSIITTYLTANIIEGKNGNNKNNINNIPIGTTNILTGKTITEVQ